MTHTIKPQDQHHNNLDELLEELKKIPRKSQTKQEPFQILPTPKNIYATFKGVCLDQKQYQFLVELYKQDNTTAEKNDRDILIEGGNIVQLHAKLSSIKYIPKTIYNLAHLRVLDLENNQLTALPPEIGQLTQLQLFHLKSNKICTLPPEIGQLRNLKTLFLSYNDLTTLPKEIGLLTELGYLSLLENPLTPKTKKYLNQLRGIGIKIED